MALPFPRALVRSFCRSADRRSRTSRPDFKAAARDRQCFVASGGPTQFL